MSSSTIPQWKKWCDNTGRKLTDESIGPDEFLRFTLVPRVIDQLPDDSPIAIDWPGELFETRAFAFSVWRDEEEFTFHECALELDGELQGQRIPFKLLAGSQVEVHLALEIDPTAPQGFRVTHIAGPAVEVDLQNERSVAADFFGENPPIIRLVSGSELSGNVLLEPKAELDNTFDRDRINALNWDGTNLKKESRWKDGEFVPQSIQERFIGHLMGSSAQILFDDDDTGESADIVAIEETDNEIVVCLYHCKYSRGNEPGQRFADLHEVCGQAQKSTRWVWSLPALIQHLRERETKLLNGRGTRFCRGDLKELLRIGKNARRKAVSFRIAVVQPGISKEHIPVQHLTLLGATNSFVLSLTDSSLQVFSSE